MIIRVAIVEDEAEQMSLVRSFVERFARESEHRFAIQTYRDGDELLDAFQPARFDILLMDIQMRRLSGMEAAEAVRKLDENVIIIFITNLAQYAVQGYGVHALNFIVKPVQYGTFKPKLAQAVEQLGRKQRHKVCFKTLEGMAQLDRADICYVELSARKLFIHTKRRTYQCYDTLQNVEEALGRGFFRCHAAFLINLDYVDRLEKNSAFIEDAEIPVSKHRRRDLVNAMTDHLSEPV